MYIIKNYEQSPFNADYIGKNRLILCNQITGEPVAEFRNPLPWYVKVDDILNKGEVSLSEVSKRSKHLVVGDTVRIGHFYEATLTKIEKVSEDGSDWDDEFYVENIKYTGPEHFVSDINQIQSPVLRRDCEHKPWLECEITFSDEKLWNILEQEWIRFVGEGDSSPSHKSLMDFWKSKTTVKK